ncbi:hypothetical protein ACWGCI_12465 [Streptomyces sp. NPDC054949]|uniref:hypothetical protein n=1 Tax=unclassified Streptomyces TaxID=2593676 RepID=UPI000A69B342|nr:MULTISPECIES: hypothetical protein [unclassified Streptomyces]MCX5074555.1 hypothetical protein [Streptomyces sp. NBC_00424]MCX5153916.1 hypothetical protein [Streptomyces sp. NBC_00291]WUD42268.1 hypothetical protein OHA84_18100 [Streptomyces sp. NBC_00513]
MLETDGNESGRDGAEGAGAAVEDARDTEAVIEAALEPHDPSAGEVAARDRVRARAEGMAHHEAAAALEAALKAAGDLSRADAPTRAAVAEWQRLTDHLLDHGGPYSTGSDAYVQGQLTARDSHRHDRVTGRSSG